MNLQITINLKDIINQIQPVIHTGACTHISYTYTQHLGDNWEFCTLTVLLIILTNHCYFILCC